MPRSRVFSFMREFGSRSPTIDSPIDATKQPPPSPTPMSEKGNDAFKRQSLNIDTIGPQEARPKFDAYGPPASPRSPSTPSRARGDSRATRPSSMIQTYQPPQVDYANDTPPELQPIFSYLNSHSNKLYQEGYFLKLHDLDSRGRPSHDRVWNECFAQLVGTVLSLWDAAALDLAGEDGEVVPTFINLSDASLKMIESLPMNGVQGGSLQNVLSISTAANNRYLLHFNSLNSLTQWTAGIRLAMFEHSTLQEAYTGSLIAGKGRFLNNIKQIMDRSKFAHEDWARVRFGAGTPWKRCWCVVSPPDEKEYQKAQKITKKGSSYGRPQLPRGDIKFYDTRKVTKKTKPIATITDAYAAYAIYPQSKPLIDQSTLVKLEGLVTIHASPETTTEGFVFVMPEVHPAVSGFEMMLRWLFPVYDTFALYGRPSRLIADVLDQRGLMFAMPRDRRYGYLDILDVSGLIHTAGSQNWSERQWRREMKRLTSTRMANQSDHTPPASRQTSQRRSMIGRTTLHATKGGVRFDEGEPIHSSLGSRSASPVQSPGAERFVPPKRTDSAPPEAFRFSPHKRSASEAQGYRKFVSETPSRLSHEASRADDFDEPPTPPKHGGSMGGGHGHERSNSHYEQLAAQAASSPAYPPPEPVINPPAFTHSPNSRPANQPYQAPELRRAHSNVDAATLFQMQDAVRPDLPQDSEFADSRQQSQMSAGSDRLPYRTHGAPNTQPQGYAGGLADSRNARQRLSTIPGSPFVGEDAGYFESPKQAHMPHLEGVAEDTSLLANVANEQVHGRPPLVPLHSSQSIIRKPVPKSLPNPPSEAGYDAAGNTQSSQVRPDSPSSPLGSLEGALIDQERLESLLNQESERSDTMGSAASSSTPDYASTAGASTRSEKKFLERPRVGKPKIVGDPDMPATDPRSGGAGRLDTYNRDLTNATAGVPNVDFGPTYVYKPTVGSRPGTSGTMTLGDADKRRSRSRSTDRLRNSSTERLSYYFGNISGTSLGESNRNSYFGGRTTPTGIEPRQPPGHRNSMIWSPGAASPGGTLDQRTSLTPEQWVQHRAKLASQPQQLPRVSPSTQAHLRTDSADRMQPSRQSSTSRPALPNRAPSGDWSQPQSRQSMTKTPPPYARTSSGDWTRNPPSRPHSRGASVHLNGTQIGHSSSSQAANLSAQEQMHVARVTGTPLIGVATNPKNIPNNDAPGLIGALAAREREKAAIKEGMRTGMVQQAIAARQQQQAQLDAEAQADMQYQSQLQAAQRAQANQFQQMAYQKAVVSPNQTAYQNHTVQQPRSTQATTAWRQQYGPGLLQQQQQQQQQQRQQLQQPQPQPQQVYYAVQQQQPYTPQVGGFRGTYVQQQGMIPGQQSPQQAQPYSGNYFPQQQGGPPGQFRQQSR